MAPNKGNITVNFAMKTGEPSSKKKTIEISADIPSFNGILLYVAPRDQPDQRVGEFTIPENMQDNSPVCKNSEKPASSVTHRAGQTYSLPMSIDYTLPSAPVMSDLVLHAVIVQKLEDGYAWRVVKEALVVETAGKMGKMLMDMMNKTDVMAPVMRLVSLS